MNDTTTRRPQEEQMADIDGVLARALTRALHRSKQSIRRRGSASLSRTTVDRIQRLDYVDGAKSHIDKLAGQKLESAGLKLAAFIFFNRNGATVVIRPFQETKDESA